MGNANDFVFDYRPISLTSVPFKIMECLKTIGELRILFNYSHQVRYIYSLPELKRLQLTRLGMRIKANQISEFKIGLRVNNNVTLRP